MRISEIQIGLTQYNIIKIFFLMLREAQSSVKIKGLGIRISTSKGNSIMF